MRDRQPTPSKENRVRITQDNGQVVEGVLAYADDATQEGSAYCKANVLPDEVCDALGIDRATSEPADALALLSAAASLSPVCIIIVRNQSGLPVVGAAVTLGGGQAITNAMGYAAFSLVAGTYSLVIRAPIDYGGGIKHTDTVAVTSAGFMTKTYSANYESTQDVILDASGTYAFSPRVTRCDLFAVGGGASGGACVINRGSTNSVDRKAVGAATGGGGGRTATKLDVATTSPLVIAIGAGGARVNASLSTTIASATLYYSNAINGLSGGDTSISIGGVEVLKATGGSAGKANADGGSSYSVYSVANGADGGSGSGGAYGHSNNGSASVGASGGKGKNGVGAKSAAGGTGQGTTTQAFGAGAAYSPAGGSAAGASTLDPPTAIVGTVASGGALALGLTIQSASTSSAASAAGVYGGGGGAALVAASYITVGNGIAYSAYSGAGKSGAVIVRWYT